MKKLSIWLTMGLLLLLTLALVALLFFCPGLCRFYGHLRGLSPQVTGAILIAFYASALPAGAALVCLLLLLRNILRKRIFSRMNTRLMSWISCCCAAVGLVCAVAAGWYLPFILVAGAMLILFLIVRVVRGCFAAALAIQEENELTI